MQRRWWWLVGLVALTALVLLVGWLVYPTEPPGINLGTYRRIRLGMTADEVEVLVGRPPGDYCTQPVAGMMWSNLYDQGTPVNYHAYTTDNGVVTFSRTTPTGGLAPVGRGLEWRDDQFVLLLALEDGRVT